MVDDQRTIAIPLVEERVTTGKRQVETGRVRVRTVVEEDQQLVCEDLIREQIEVERVPMDVELTEYPEVREEDGFTIIPVVEEVLVVEKKLVLIEEVRLRRRSDRRRYESPVTVSSQRAVIEREEGRGAKLDEEQSL
jgi:uncharacterized protein (TIGR02271 family)